MWGADPGEKRSDDLGQVADVHEEGVVAVWRLQIAVGNLFAGAEHGVGNLHRLFRREKPVRTQCDDENFALDGFERLFEAAELFGQVVFVDGAGDVKIGIGIESVDELIALVIQVTFHLEVRCEIGVGIDLVVFFPAELGGHDFR